MFFKEKPKRLFLRFNRSQQALACCLFLLTFSAFGIDPNSKEPIEIESDSATLDDKTGISSYTGNVIISQGQSRLEAEYILVSSQDRKISSIVATGSPAHFVQKADGTSTHGYGNSISYNTELESLTFKGNAKLIQAENSFSGEEIEYDVTKKAIKAKGDENIGTRVKIQYYPNTTEK